jgi:DNA-binding response OmpR family regulator
VLERHGYDVDSAKDEEEARRLVRASRYDAVLLDYLLPDADGLTIHDHLVAADPGLEGRVVFLTGGGQRQEESLGGRGLPYVLKPFDIRALASVVHRTAGEGPPRGPAT